MTDDIGQRLSAVFDARAADVAVGPAPVQAIDARARQLTHRRWLAASLTTVAAVAVVVVAVALTLGQNSHRPPAVGGASPTGGSLPTGTPTGQPVSPSVPTSAGVAPVAPIRSQADAVRRYLETADLWKQAGITTSFHGRLYCGLKILGHSPDGTRLFTWVLCQEYYDDAGVATAGSGTSEALLVNVTGSGAHTVVHSVEAPQGDGAYVSSVRRLFDRASADIVLSGKPIAVDQPDKALLAQARADLAAGALPGPSTGSATAAAVCGPWSAAGSTFADVVQAYGAIESCFRYDGSTVAWVITTDGTAGQPGVVGIDWCTDAAPACLDGSVDHTTDLWTFYPARAVGSVRLYAQPKAGYPLALTVGGKQQSFDPATATFADIAAAQSPSAPTGKLVAGIVTVGGPPVPVGASASTPHHSSGQVHLSREGRIIAEAYLEDQTWQLSLAPGTYTLTTASGCPAATADIRTGTTTHTDITCNVP